MTGPGAGSSGKSKKPLAIIGAIGALVLALVVGLLVLAFHGGSDKSDEASGGSGGGDASVAGDSDQPQTKPVVDYFNALQKGDVEGIKKGATVPDSASEAALTSAVLTNMKDKVHNVKVTDPGSSTIDTTSVSVSYDIKDRSYSQTYFVNKGGGDWHLENNDLPDVSLDASSSTIQVNGQDVTVEKKDYGSTSIALPPGGYTLGVAGSKYLTATSKDVTVTEGSVLSRVDLKSSLTPAATADAQKQVNAFVKKCAADPSVSTDCPMSSGDRYTYKVTKMPTISLDSDFEDGKYRVSTKVVGKATYTDPDDSSFTGDESLTMFGHVTMNGDKLTYDPSI